MKAIITDAGFASRYLPITKTIPKAMIPIGAKPVMQLCVEECAEAGCVGMRIAAELCQREIPLKWLSLKNLGDGVITGGKVPMLKRLKGIDAESVAETIIKEIGDE
jgi:UTP--glucose-1-phosphate uridylyltransferase